MSIRLSIVIPCYNSFDTLLRLIDSIISEVEEEVEILVVDDKSTKDIEKLRNYYSVNRNFILLENTTATKGAGVCRNIGLKSSKGDWVLFADADDYFITGWYQIVQQYFDSQNDIIFFNPISIMDETGEPSVRSKRYNDIIAKYKTNDIKTDFRIRYGFVAPWSKLIRKKFIDDNNIQFEETMYSNDVMFSTISGFEANKIHVDPQTIYCISDEKNTLTKKKSEDSFFIRCEVECRRYKYLINKVGKKNYLKYRKGPPVGLWILKVICQRKYKNKKRFIKLILENHLPIIPRPNNFFGII